MQERTDAAASGMDTIRAVAEYWMGQLDTDRDMMEAVHVFYGDSITFMQNPLGRHAWLALAASILNSQFERTGRYFVIGKECQIETTFVATDSERAAIKSLLFGDK